MPHGKLFVVIVLQVSHQDAPVVADMVAIRTSEVQIVLEVIVEDVPDNESSLNMAPITPGMQNNTHSCSAEYNFITRATTDNKSKNLV